MKLSVFRAPDGLRPLGCSCWLLPGWQSNLAVSIDNLWYEAKQAWTHSFEQNISAYKKGMGGENVPVDQGSTCAWSYGVFFPSWLRPWLTQSQPRTGHFLHLSPLSASIIPWFSFPGPVPPVCWPGRYANRNHCPLRSAAARARSVKGRVRTPETPGNMAALMTLSQVTTLNSSRKVLNLTTDPYQVTVTAVVWPHHTITL